MPIFVLEVVSQKYRGEYSRKKQLYAEMGVLYYGLLVASPPQAAARSLL